MGILARSQDLGATLMFQCNPDGPYATFADLPVEVAIRIISFAIETNLKEYTSLLSGSHRRCRKSLVQSACLSSLSCSTPGTSSIPSTLFSEVIPPLEAASGTCDWFRVSRSRSPSCAVTSVSSVPYSWRVRDLNDWHAMMIY
jgi:hypothetical protein